jgi:hypothetical protein
VLAELFLFLGFNLAVVLGDVLVVLFLEFLAESGHFFRSFRRFNGLSSGFRLLSFGFSFLILSSFLGVLLLLFLVCGLFLASRNLLLLGFLRISQHLIGELCWGLHELHGQG